MDGSYVQPVRRICGDEQTSEKRCELIYIICMHAHDIGFLAKAFYGIVFSSSETEKVG